MQNTAHLRGCIAVKLFGKPWWLVLGVAFFAYYLITDPTGAGHFVHSAFGWLGNAAHSLKIFLQSL
jgi:hypothetical protein